MLMWCSLHVLDAALERVGGSEGAREEKGFILSKLGSQVVFEIHSSVLTSRNVAILEGGEWRKGIFHRVWRDQPRGVSPRLIPTHKVGITHALEHRWKYWHYFSRGAKPWSVCAKLPLGCLSTIRSSLLQGSRIRFFLGCVIPRAGAVARSCNLGQDLFGSPEGMIALYEK